MINAFLIIIHVFVSIVLILVVLLQTGKRADLAGAFGGGGSQTALGTRGAATFLSKMTTASAIIFMLTSLSLAILSTRKRGEETVLDKARVKQEVPASSAPAIPQSPPAGTSQTETIPLAGQSEEVQQGAADTGAPQEKGSAQAEEKAP
ncbi:MAG: preprotein translocase subunit SecG [Acidobacteriota bacterium]